MAIHELHSENFDSEVLSSKEPVLVDFWAPWCGPCKMLEPHVKAISEEMKSVKVAKVNIDDEPQLAQKYSVMSVPTLLFFQDGKVMDQIIGVQSKEDIANKLEQLKG